MKAVIVSASKPLFNDTPIFNNTIGENNLIDLQVSILRNAGIEDISVVVGYKGNLFSRSDVDVIINDSWQSSGSAYSLLKGLNYNHNLEDTLVVYGDTIFLPNFVIFQNAKLVISLLPLENRLKVTASDETLKTQTSC